MPKKGGPDVDPAVLKEMLELALDPNLRPRDFLPEGPVDLGIIGEMIEQFGGGVSLDQLLDGDRGIDDNVQFMRRPDGSTSMMLAPFGGLDRFSEAETVKSWLEADCKPNPGTPQDVLRRRDELFAKLRDIDAKAVVDLACEYFNAFPPHPGRDFVTQDMADAGGSVLSNLEAYLFDPDRTVAMCKALQDAVRQTAAQTEGPVTVLEAGYGLGFVAMSALALNEELDDRVRVVGLEVNKATAHRAAQILDYYGIGKDRDGDPFVDMYPADASQILFDNVKIHILVAEHLSSGVFCKEPLHAIHRNVVPILSEPFFIIPEGVDIYGRVVKANGYLTSDDIRSRVGRVLEDRKERINFRSIEFPEIEQMLGGVNDELLRGRLLKRVRFADVLNGEWDGNLDLNLRGKSDSQGKGLVELRGVPRFHTDGEVPELSPMRFYAHNIDPEIPPGEDRFAGVYYGTSLNWWNFVRGNRAWENLYTSLSRDPSVDSFEMSSRLMFDPSLSPRMKIRKGKMNDISISGSMSELSADVRFAEASAQSGNMGSRKRPKKKKRRR